MNVLVIGLGSMGKRRIRLMKQYLPGIVVSGVDINQERRDFVHSEYSIDTYASVKEAIQENAFTHAFICAAPLAHAQLIEYCLEHGLHVFSELNLVADGYNNNMLLAENKAVTLFLSSTFLYREEVRFLLAEIKKSKVALIYTYHVGQYLPDWHPWESVHDFFVGNKRTNGCRELFAVELPWLLCAFGKVTNMHVLKNNISSLKLGYADQYMVTLEHETGHKGQMIVDVVSRVPVRHFEVFGEDIQLEWRGKPEDLWRSDSNFSSMQLVSFKNSVERVTGYADFVVENAYWDEMKEFFAVCVGEKESSYSFDDDLYTLSLIDQIER